MTIVSWLECDEDATAEVLNRPLKEVLTISGLDPDVDFPGFVPGEYYEFLANVGGVNGWIVNDKLWVGVDTNLIGATANEQRSAIGSFLSDLVTEIEYFRFFDADAGYVQQITNVPNITAFQASAWFSYTGTNIEEDTYFVGFGDYSYIDLAVNAWYIASFYARPDFAAEAVDIDNYYGLYIGPVSLDSVGPATFWGVSIDPFRIEGATDGYALHVGAVGTGFSGDFWGLYLEDSAAYFGSFIEFANQSDAAAAAVGTLTNAPSVGNPAFWLPITINGVDYAIPCWAQ